MNEVDILGIDLGPTNSAIVMWEPDTGQVRVLHNCEGDGITPSIVMFDLQTRQPIVGKLANKAKNCLLLSLLRKDRFLKIQQ